MDLSTIVKGLRTQYGNKVDELVDSFFLAVETAKQKASVSQSVKDDAPQKISDLPEVSAMTLYMQATFDLSYVEANRSFEGVKSSRTNGLSFILRELDDLCGKVGNDLNIKLLKEIYDKMIDYLIQYCALDGTLTGSIAPGTMTPAEYQIVVRKEVAIAFESVFRRSGLRDFANQLPADRHRQLDEFSLIVLGIRLYNNSIGKGGGGIGDTPTLALKESSELKKILETSNEGIERLAQEYSDCLLAIDSTDFGKSPLVTGAEKWPLELLNRRQASDCVVTLAQSLADHHHHLSILEPTFSETLRSITSALSSPPSSTTASHTSSTLSSSMSANDSNISKEKVLPLFSELGGLWLSAAESRETIKALRTVFDSVRPFLTAEHVCTLPFNAHLEAIRCLSKLEGVDATLGVRSPPVHVPPSNGEDGNSKSDRYWPNVSLISSGDAIPSGARVELQGYCPVSISRIIRFSGGVKDAGSVEASKFSKLRRNTHDIDIFQDSSSPATNMDKIRISERLTIHHDDSMGPVGWTVQGDNGGGFVQYNGRLYACSSARSRSAFASNPRYYLDILTGIAFLCPELINLFQLGSDSDAAPVESAFQDARMTSLLRPKTRATRLNKKGIEVSDVASETPVHFQLSHIDPKYEFSEWALRRRAIKLANLMNCVTHSAQTDESHFRRETILQVNPQRTVTFQTPVEVGSNTNKLVRHITGVVGVPDPVVAYAVRNLSEGKRAIPDPENIPKFPTKVSSASVNFSIPL